jgi:hypothetical protein
MAVGVGIWLAGEPGDDRLGPYGALLPLFFFLTGLSVVFSGLSDLRAPAERATILRLRLVSTAVRIAAFGTWMITLIGLVTE